MPGTACVSPPPVETNTWELSGGLMKSFMLWLNQMIRGRGWWSLKEKPCVHRKGRIKHFCDSVITDRTAADYRASAALAGYRCRHRHKDAIYINMLEVRVNIAYSVVPTQWWMCHKIVNMQILLQSSVHFLPAAVQYLFALVQRGENVCTSCILQTRCTPFSKDSYALYKKVKVMKYKKVRDVTLKWNIV